MHIQNKTSFIVCRYVGRILYYSEEFVLSDLEKLELLMDLEETYNLNVDPKKFLICNTIEKIEDLLFKSRKPHELNNVY